MYEAIGALSGEAAWQAESDWSRRWMQDRFDQSRLATERETIMARGRSQSSGLGIRRREGLRGHGPAAEPPRGHRARQAGRAAGLRRPPCGRNRARRDGAGVVGGRAHIADHGADERGPGVHAQPDAAGLHGVGHLQVQQRPIPARPGHADPPEHRGPLRGAVRGGSDRPAARLRRRRARRVRLVRVGPGAVIRERALPGDAAPALLQPGARHGHRRAAGLPGRRAAARLRAGRGGGRRLREPPDQLQSALPDRDLSAGAGRGRPLGGAGPRVGRLRDGRSARR